MLKVGIKAPDFSLKDMNGKIYSLSDFLGQKVVLYFYPKDSTSGCTKQALGFKENYEKFLSKGIVVIGISKDSEKSHKNFIEKYELPFLLLSDPELIAIKGYDVWHEKKLYGKPYMGVVRTTYVIDENGIIVDANGKVKAESNANDLVCELD